MTIESSTSFLHIIISLAILLFAAKLFAELFHRIKMPVVLGELLAGIVVGPFALGGLPIFNGEPLVMLDETVKHIGEIAAIVILFIAGLEITPREFLRGGGSITYCWVFGCHITFLCRILCIHCFWVRGARIYANSYGINCN